MKRNIFFLLTFLAILSLTTISYSQTYGQATCSSGAATRLGASWGGAHYKSFSILNQTPTTGVYIGPDASVTSSNGGILLGSTTAVGVIFENGDSPWYCITASGSATVGYNITAR